MKEMLKLSGISYEINSVPLLNRSARVFSKATSSALSVKTALKQIFIAAIDLQSKSTVTRTDPDDARCEHIYGGTRNGSL